MMTATNSSCQVVFLIDTCVEKIYITEKTLAEKYFKSISLSVLRILSYFSSQKHLKESARGTKNSPLKWGYKFFDSKTHSIKVEKYSFKDFKLKYYEEFEREIQKRIKSKISVDKPDHSEKDKKKNSKISPCDCYNRALTEVIDDYEWDTPDLFSPVKRRRIPKRKEKKCTNSNDPSGNFVFILSMCPKTSECLRQFAKKRVLDSNVLLDVFMPPSLFTKFCERYQLKLFWIDTDCNVDNVQVEFDSIKLIEEALEKTNGKIIPINAVVQYGKEHFSNVNFLRNIDVIRNNETERKAEEEGQKQVSCSILPFTTILKYYLSRNNCRPLPDKSSSSYKCLLQYKDLKICNLHISLSHNGKQRMETCSKSTLIKGTDDLPLKEEVNINYKSEDLEPLCNISTFEVYSILRKSIYPETNLVEIGMFVCVASDAESTEMHRSEKFQEILAQLSSQNSYLVLLAKDVSRFFLLKPLTASSATLTVMTTKVILEIEKQLEIQRNKTFTREDPPTTETDAKNWQGLMTKLCSNTISKFKKCDLPERREESVGGAFNPSSIDKIHLPGCQPAFVSLIDKLNDKISQLEFLSDSEVKTLKQLQKMYHVESRPPKLIDHTPKSKEPADFFDQKDTNISINEDLKDDKRRDSVQSRGQMIVTRSKQAVKEREDNPEKAGEGAPVQSKPIAAACTNVDFKDEEELKNYLNEMYNRTLENETGSLYSSVQSFVTIALHYMREKGKDNPQESSEQLLKSAVILSVESLRQKHQEDLDQQLKIREYQLQIILRLEIQSMTQIDDQNTSVSEDKVEEIVTLLRTISFITEPKVLSEFMRNTLVVNFVHNLSQMLGSIYDELMQPYPAELESILSPDESAADSSVFDQSLQSCGGETSMSQPPSAVSDILLNRSDRSSRSRKLVHHPSLVDFGPKRQIVVATKPGKEKHQRSDINRQKKRERDKEKRKLERRQSVAVMESIKTSSRKRSANLMKSPKFNSSTRKLVSETPAHKQKKNNMWKRLEKERRRTQSVIDVKVVAESPIKSDLVEKCSPSQRKKSLTAVRRSFYSAGPINRSVSLTNGLDLANRIAGKKTKRQSLFDLKSPDRNSSFLFSQLMGSPETIRKTPGKKFSLSQSLLSPSQNTRSKTPSKVMSSQKSLFKDKSPKRSIKKLSFTPVKEISNQNVIIPDSPSLNTRSHTPNKVSVIRRLNNTPMKSPVVNTSLLLSPSQSTRSKVTATPTRLSVKAKLFDKSPELKASSRTPVKNESPAKHVLGKRALNLFEKDPDVKENVVEISNVKMGANASLDLLEKNEHCHNKSEASSGLNTQKTPSPSKKMIVKTPNSINSWPRKKKWTKIKYDNRNEQVCEENESFKDSNGSSSDDEIEIRINDQIDDDDRTETVNKGKIKLEQQSMNMAQSSLKRSLTLSPETKRYDTPSKRRRLLISPSKISEKDGNKDRSEIETETTQVQNLLKMSRKRNSNLSFDKSVDSPNKRQRISLVKDNMNLLIKESQYSLSSQPDVFKKNFSEASDGILSSQGFDTNFKNSQNSSCHSQDILSVASNDSQEYFSASNDEVFLSPSRRSRTSSQLTKNKAENLTLMDLSNISNIRSDSPVFGSSKKLKSLFQNRCSSQESDPNEDGFSIRSPAGCKVLQTDDTKLSPSARKYSPSVSAKSLCHLISSPILNSPTTRKGNGDSHGFRKEKISQNTRRTLMPD